VEKIEARQRRPSTWNAMLLMTLMMPLMTMYFVEMQNVAFDASTVEPTSFDE
jgi:hypothetical protein